MYMREPRKLTFKALDSGKKKGNYLTQSRKNQKEPLSSQVLI